MSQLCSTVKIMFVLVSCMQRLLVRVDRLETENGELEERVRNFTLTSPTPLSPLKSPIPFSPPPFTSADLDDETASLSSSSNSMQLLEQISQMEFENNETEIKFQELSTKYQTMKVCFLCFRHNTEEDVFLRSCALFSDGIFQ